jgi:PIN domain nuclease of toxin-antitoxin system
MAGGIAMKLLLDTCAVLWLADAPEKLGSALNQPFRLITTRCMFLPSARLKSG